MTGDAGETELAPAGGRRFGDPQPLDESAARPPDSLADYAMAAVRNDLLTGRLRPGERITAEAKAAELGISHIPVREAFRFLEAEGHVIRDGRRGVRIAPLSVDEAGDIYHTRALLEAEANRLGIPRLTQADDARLAEYVHRMEEASRIGDLGAYRRFNRAFHFVAFERSGRPWLVRFLRILWDAAARYQSPLFTEGAWKAAHPTHHRSLFEALLCRDVEAVNAEMDEHRRWLLDRVVERGTSAGASATAPAAASGASTAGLRAAGHGEHGGGTSRPRGPDTRDEPAS